MADGVGSCWNYDCSGTPWSPSLSPIRGSCPCDSGVGRSACGLAQCDVDEYVSRGRTKDYSPSLPTIFPTIDPLNPNQHVLYLPPAWCRPPSPTNMCIVSSSHAVSITRPQPI